MSNPGVMAAVKQALSDIQDPYLGLDLWSAGVFQNLDSSEKATQVYLTLPYPNHSQTAQLRHHIAQKISTLMAINTDHVMVHCNWEIKSHKNNDQIPNLREVKNIIAVASGKGGVGKSTVAVNLALALLAEGAHVGLLDADIYGPSQGLMLGVSATQKPEIVENTTLLPLMAHGLKTMSMAYLVTEKTPMVWRGPMASGALLQLMSQTQWGPLDCLFVDMPPGTGDIQLTLSQKFPVSGALIVTTPQAVALADAKKGIEMFRKVHIPVLGIIENMSGHTCSHCGFHENIFGSLGAAQLARDYESEVLGTLPLSTWIRIQGDNGRPSVIADPNHDIAKSYRKAALTLAARLGQRAVTTKIPTSEITFL